MINFLSHSEEETKNLAMKIASQVKFGDILILSGDLGSGKTKFVEGFLTYFNLQNEISSPTFTIVNEYDTNNFKIFHFDVYRLEDTDEFATIGGEEYFEKGISLIEWGEQIENVLPNSYTKITFNRDYLDNNVRNISIEFFGNSKYEID